MARMRHGIVLFTSDRGITPAAAATLQAAWADAGRAGRPEISVLAARRPPPEDMAAWDEAGVTEILWGLPDKSEDEVLAFLSRHAGRLGP